MLATIETERGKLQVVIDNMESLSEPKKAIILYCYGLNGERSDRHRMPIKLARQLKSMDIAVLRFDYTGLGISDGEFYHTTLQSKVEDTLQVLNFVGSKMSHVRNVILLGFSDGAAVAMASVVYYTEKLNITGVLLWSPLMHVDIEHITIEHKPSPEVLPQTMDNLNISQHAASENRYRPVTRGGAITLPAFGLWKNIKYNNLQDALILDAFGKRGIATCMICPEEDYRVIPTARHLTNRLGSNARLHHIPNADHTFNRSDWEADVRTHSIGWIRSLLHDTAILDC
jgi:alpha/beta superfamily hydrolase